MIVEQLMRRALAGFLFWTGCAMPLSAQWGELTIGAEAEQYLRAMQLRGVWGGEASAIRPYGPQPVRRWMRDSLSLHPWSARFRADSGMVHRVHLLRPMVMVNGTFGDFPWGFNDGALWQGMGLTTAASVGVSAHWRWISLRVEPLFFRAQNGNFTLAGDTTRGINAFVDQQRPGSIDLPQRFGRTPYQRVDPGQSELRFDIGPFAAGVSTMPQVWGPGMRHALFLTGTGPGIPHLFLGTSRAWRTPAGRLSGKLLYGKAKPSGFEPSVAVRDRLVSGLVASWQPPSGRRVEIGVARFYHHFWPEGGFRLKYLSLPFGSLFKDVQIYEGGPADNQLASVFFRWRAEDDGFEVYGEFGRTDRSIDARDVALEPEHNAAWLAGFSRLFGLSASSFWLVRGDVANGRIGSITRLSRGQSTIYDHSPITQGHTVRGQLLGTYLLERTGGLEVSVDRYARWGRVGGVLTQRAMPEDLSEGVRAAAARSQWAVEGSATRFVGKHDLFMRAGLVLDVNRRPGTDATAKFLALGVRMGGRDR